MYKGPSIDSVDISKGLRKNESYNPGEDENMDDGWDQDDDDDGWGQEDEDRDGDGDSNMQQIEDEN